MKSVHGTMHSSFSAVIARRDGLYEEATSVLAQAVITHDFGKAHSSVIDHHGRITSGGHAETGVEPARDFLERIGAPGRYAEKILPLIDRHMCHNPGGDVEISDSAVGRLLRRLDHAGGGPTLQTWARLVEADKAGRGPGAKKGRNYVPHWLAVAEKLGNETAVTMILLKGPYLADAGVPRGPLWAHIVAMSTEAQDDGVFAEKDRVKTWLAEKKDQLVMETALRHAEAKENGSRKGHRRLPRRRSARKLRGRRPVVQMPP